MYTPSEYINNICHILNIDPSQVNIRDNSLKLIEKQFIDQKCTRQWVINEGMIGIELSKKYSILDAELTEISKEMPAACIPDAVEIRMILGTVTILELLVYLTIINEQTELVSFSNILITELNIPEIKRMYPNIRDIILLINNESTRRTILVNSYSQLHFKKLYTFFRLFPSDYVSLYESKYKGNAYDRVLVACELTNSIINHPNIKSIIDRIEDTYEQKYHEGIINFKSLSHNINVKKATRESAEMAEDVSADLDQLNEQIDILSKQKIQYELKVAVIGPLIADIYSMFTQVV